MKIKEFIADNGSYKIVALLITLILWVTVLGSKDLVIYKTVKLDFVLPPNSIVVNALTDQVQVQISGSRLSLKKIYKGLSPLVINLKDAKLGRTVVGIPADDIGLPFGAKILNLSPSSVVLDLDKVIERWLPIKVDVIVDSGSGKKIRVLNVKPNGLQIKGASSVISRLDALWTEPLDLKQIPLDSNKKSIEIRTQLKDVGLAGILPIEEKAVTVTAYVK